MLCAKHSRAEADSQREGALDDTQGAGDGIKLRDDRGSKWANHRQGAADLGRQIKETSKLGLWTTSED